MFHKQVTKDIETLFADSEDISNNVFAYDQLSELPEPVQRYFKYSLKDGQRYISYVRLKHNGTFRTNEGQKWMPISMKKAKSCALSPIGTGILHSKNGAAITDNMRKLME